MKALRILYLEDNTDHVELVTFAVQPQFPGTHVESAAVMPDAIACLQSRRYDMILVSATLQGGSIVPRLHEIVAYANSSPVIVISGDGDEKNAANAIKHGASDYLVKSRESLEVLPYLIQRLLKKKRPVAPDSHPTPQTSHPSDGVGQLMTEIEHVSQRIHNLQAPSHLEAAISSLREDLRLLREFAEGLVHPGKSRKSKN